MKKTEQAAKTASKKDNSKKVAANKAQDPKLNATQQKIYDNKDLTKSEKFRRLYAKGLSKAHIARLFGSPYSFVLAAIGRQEGLEEEVAAKNAEKEAVTA